MKAIRRDMCDVLVGGGGNQCAEGGGLFVDGELVDDCDARIVHADGIDRTPSRLVFKATMSRPRTLESMKKDDENV